VLVDPLQGHRKTAVPFNVFREIIYQLRCGWSMRPVSALSLGSGAGGSVRLKRLMRLKPPPHRGEVCALSALCALSPRIGGFGLFDWEPEGGRPAFSLSANSLLTAASITSALMLCCSRLRQEPCCPPGPNPPSRGAVSRKCAKSAISALFIFRRFFVFPYRFPHFVPVRPLRWPTRGLLQFWRLR
jgi:hypothetical protein